MVTYDCIVLINILTSIILDYDDREHWLGWDGIVWDENM